ncbi:LysR family transcriptional regulator [Legionella brunensis]|uniref:LysR family transporter transcriptional regulator n=1 Tax=Legionella brunensis TaxID=29422 RepID=A0A0W0S579_9GAMM|nr:LysR family transcriptional regulator [Legionella brunensis]KTC78189.1 LysR family transporter transcriptional regulator [Legionella brunensis]
MINFDSMRIFVVVVECGGFNAAAQSLFKTQPAITSAVKKLEGQLGFSLFDRSSYRPQLTTLGEKFYQRAKVLIGHWQHVNEFADNLQAEMESDITIAIDVFYPLTALKPLFCSWILHYPQTHIHFLTESLGGACERLIEHQADIIISENLISQHAIEVIPLLSERMPAVAAPEFIRQYEQQLASLDTLNDCMQVILRDSSKENFTFGVIEHCRHWTVSDVIAKKQIIMAGLGWGRLPEHLITEELIDGRLELLTGNHFDERLITLSAIRLQKPIHGPIVEKLWADLLQLKNCRA